MRKGYVGALSIPLALGVTDRVLKWYADAASAQDAVILFPGLVFKYFKNEGLLFSLFTPVVAIPVQVAAIIFFAVLCVRAGKKSEHHQPGWIATALFIGIGGASNVFDRITTGGVTDYFLFINRSAFNLADGMIFAGIVLAIILSHRSNTKGGNSIG